MQARISTTYAPTSKKGPMFTVWILSGLCAAGAVGGSTWLLRHKTAAKPVAPSLVYTSKGFGGYTLAPDPNAVRPVSHDPVLPALKAYQHNDYKEAEALAEPVIRQYQGASKPEEKKYAVLAQWIDAYAAGRRNDFQVARERFSYLRYMAALLPDHGKWPNKPGEVTPTLEEEGAFQHAVCTSAIGDQKGAEAEYYEFMRSYPTSVLVHGAVKRIARLHKGNIPSEAEALWQQAMQIQKKADKAERRAASMCGPECLVELLRRRGQKADVEALAREMKTDETGTSVLAVAECARKHGLQAQGIMVKPTALVKQPFPAIAFLNPGHFVLVEAATPSEVRVWNPPARNGKVGGPQTYDTTTWRKVWQGVLLSVQ